MGKIFSDSSLIINPKFFKLMDYLKVGKVDAFWHLHLLWFWCSDHYPEGIMKDVSDVSIALATEWSGKPKAFVDALVNAGFLDRESGTLVVHDWVEWRSDQVRMKARRRTDHERSANEVRTNAGAPHSSSPAVLSFPVSGTTEEWLLREGYVSTLKDLYPGVDVILECKKALNWVQTNPTRKKTQRGMPKFLAGWLERCQNRPPRYAVKTSAEKDAEFEAMMANRRAIDAQSDKLVEDFLKNGKRTAIKN